jgi:RNA polymerase sigma factor (sigma-70 family)
MVEAAKLVMQKDKDKEEMKEERLQELLSLIAGGDEQAFEELYLEYSQAILFHVRNLLADKESYQDVAQEVAIKIYMGIGKLNNAKAFHGWMHMIIRNTCADANRKYLRESGRGMLAGVNDDPLADLIDTDFDSDPVIGSMRKSDAKLMFSMVMSMSEAYREILILRYYDELSYSEISQAMGISVATVGTNLMKAKNKLKKMMQSADKGKMPIDSLNVSIAYGAGILIPPLATKQFAIGIKAKLALIAKGDVTQASSSTAAKSDSSISAKTVAVCICIIIMALGIGATAVHLHYANDAAPVEPIDVTTIQQESVTISFNPDARIIFADAKSKNVAKNPVIAKVGISENDVIVRSEYRILNELNETIISGIGETLTGIDALETGKYIAVFTLTDGRGAQCEVSRTFYVND